METTSSSLPSFLSGVFIISLADAVITIDEKEERSVESLGDGEKEMTVEN